MTSAQPPGTPLWRQAFDAAEKAVTPHAESLVRTPGFATGVTMLRRAQSMARETARGVSARAWHLVNLPAGSDLARLRTQIGALDREVRRLTVQLENERRTRAADPTPEEPDADGPHSPGGARPRPPRRGAQRPPRP